MATGRQAFSGSTSAAVFDGILNRTPVPPLQLNPQLPPKLEEILEKALEKDLKLRYQTASDFRVDLQRLRRESDSHPSTKVAAQAAAAQPISARPPPALVAAGRHRCWLRQSSPSRSSPEPMFWESAKGWPPAFRRPPITN